MLLGKSALVALKPFPFPSLSKYLQSSTPAQKNVAEVDDHGDGGCGLHVLKKLRAISGCWVSIELVDDTTKRSRALRLFALEHPDCNDNAWVPAADAVYLHPQLLFNVGVPVATMHTSPSFHCIIRLSKFPLAATMITIARIERPLTCDSDVEEIADYFSKPVVVAKGDVFGVVHTPKLPETPIEQRVYYKVQSVDSSNETDTNACVFLDGRETKVIESGACVTSRTPSHGNFQDVIPGLEDVASELLQLIDAVIRQPNAQVGLKLSILIEGPAGVGKATTVRKVGEMLGVATVDIDCSLSSVDGVPSNGRRVNVFSQQVAEAAKTRPGVVLLKNIQHLEKSQENNDPTISEAHFVLSQLAHRVQYGDTDLCILIATAESLKDLSLVNRSLFTHVITTKTPDLENRKKILRKFLCIPSNEKLVDFVADKTAGRVTAELKSIVAHATLKSRKRMLTTASPRMDISMEDIEFALDHLLKISAATIGAPKVPQIKWEEVGGLENVKQEILDVVELPLKYPKMFESTHLRPRSGVLLYGPPGTGKTLVAKAVASQCSLSFLSVKGPELISMYVGESEKNIREVFRKGRDAAPCIIFFDELDSLAPKRGHSGDSGGVMDRVVSQFLAELDGVVKSTNLFVLGATNRPDLIDDALLRPGRFDRLLYVPICESEPAKLQVMTALTRKFNVAANVDYGQVVSKFPKAFTGADMYAVAADAWQRAASRLFEAYEQEQKQQQQESYAMSDACSSLRASDVVVTQQDFLFAAEIIKPSVSEKDMKYYQRLHKQFEKPTK